MAFSGRARKWMQVWVVLAGIMFFAQCAVQARPYLNAIFGPKRVAGDTSAPLRR